MSNKEVVRLYLTEELKDTTRGTFSLAQISEDIGIGPDDLIIALKQLVLEKSSRFSSKETMRKCSLNCRYNQVMTLGISTTDFHSVGKKVPGMIDPIYVLSGNPFANTNCKKINNGTQNDIRSDQISHSWRTIFRNRLGF
jgi:hypothetical protein